MRAHNILYICAAQLLVCAYAPLAMRFIVCGGNSRRSSLGCLVSYSGSSCSLSLCFGCGDGDRVFPGSSIISPRRAECYTCMDLSGSHPGKLHKLWTRLAEFRASAVDGAAATVNPDGLSCPGVVRIDGCQGGGARRSPMSCKAKMPCGPK